MAAKKFATPIDLSQFEIQNALIQLLASDPGSPVNGQIWVNSSTWQVKVRLNGVTITLGRLDQISAPTASVSMNSQRITNLADPSSAQDAATQSWVQGLVAASGSGTEWKAQAKLATAAALPSNTYSSGGKTLTATANGALTVDSVGVAVNDRILVKNESTGSNNGIYNVANAGGAGAPYVLTRAADADATSELQNGIIIPVTSGTVNADTLWALTTDAPTLDTTSLAFSQLPLAGYTAASPVTLTGNQFGLTTVPLSKGGTNAVDAAGAKTQLGFMTRFIATGPSSGGTSWTVNHALGTKEVVYMLRDASTDAEVVADVVSTDANNLTVNFGASISANAYKIVVIG